ncbi:MAG: DUF2950 domain-containing protein [Thermodesulfobacteriota bacterium]
MFMTFRKFSISQLLLPALFAVLLSVAPGLAATDTSAQKSFASPEEAVKSLVQAARSNDTTELAAILGPGSQDIVSSGDPVADKSGRERFVSLYDEKIVIEGAEDGWALVSLGNEDFPFPIPVVKDGDVWRFDTEAGREELLNRRIGRNELEVIDVLRAYVDAQREYAATDWDGDGAVEFAQQIRSTPGKKDGLHWAANEGEPESPLGPLAAEAAQEGYAKENTALYGYRYRILKAQGKDAAGGGFDYLVNGRMILGFAMVAYPVQYGASGIMTFMVNHNGIVFQKDLGENSAGIAAAMEIFNPDAGWSRVE